MTVTANSLSPEDYGELKRAARSILRRSPNRTVDPTSLVHRAWDKVNNSPDHWKSKSHYLAVAKLAMRQSLIDEHRKRKPQPMSDTLLDMIPGSNDWDPSNLADLLAMLAKYDERQARIAQRKLEGFTNLEQAEIERVCVSTIEAEWRHARAWLRTKLEQGGS